MSKVFNLVWAYPPSKEARFQALAPNDKQLVVTPRSVDAVILFPSLMSPSIYQQSADDPWIELLIASGVELTPGDVCRHLKVSPGLSAKKVVHREELFAGTHGRIEVASATPEGGVVRTHKKFAGAIHALFMDRLNKRGFSKLFKVRVHHEALLNAESANLERRPAGQSHEQRLAWRSETHDYLLKDMLEQRNVFESYGYIPGKGTYTFRPNAETGLQLWDLPEPVCEEPGAAADLSAAPSQAIDWQDPVQAYHPVYFYPDGGGAPRHLNFGHLTDIHVNGRLDILQQTDAHVIPEVDASVSEPVSRMIEPTNRSFARLLTAMASDKGVDALLLGGDLIDHQINAFCASPPKPTMLATWDAVDLEKQADRRYVAGVDMVSLYSLVLKVFCRASRKPVFGISGNHDAYLKPFGISPRALGLVRANEGIPADVNLTFYEAALAFGPTWTDCEEHLPGTDTPISSFIGEWMEWFYTVFTPFTDFSIQLPKQQLVCLGWGGDEVMLLGGQGMTHLPRANESLNSMQLKLVREAEGAHAERAPVLLTHFTVSSFNDDIPLRNNGKPAKGSLQGDVSEFNMGTFEGLRAPFIDLLGQRNISCVFSGHSHRRGSYFLGGGLDENHDGELDFGKQGIVLYDPAQVNWSKVPEDKRKPLLVVSDSGGPYPRYNWSGEFDGWGSDKPSASVVKFDAAGQVESVRIVRHGGQAKPRLAVAVDYVDVLKSGVWEGAIQTDYFDPADERQRLTDGFGTTEVFYGLSFKLKDGLTKIGLRLRSVSLYAVGQGIAPLVMSLGGKSEFAFVGQQNLRFQQWIKRGKGSPLFASVRFDWPEGSPVHSKYNVASPWNFEVEVVIDSKDRYDQVGQYLRRYRIRRPLRTASGSKSAFAQFPEVPNFAWRKQRAQQQEKAQAKASEEQAPSETEKQGYR